MVSDRGERSPLAAKHPGRPLAPTRDIDEMWHLHMLRPRAYYQDCIRLFGKVLDHDGGFGKGEGELPALMSAFDQTAALWLSEYDEPYLVADAECNSRHSDSAEKCWHNCGSRCWHACKSVDDRQAPAIQ